MKAILLLAALHMLIIHQSAKKESKVIAPEPTPAPKATPYIAKPALLIQQNYPLVFTFQSTGKRIFIPIAIKRL